MQFLIVLAFGMLLAGNAIAQQSTHVPAEVNRTYDPELYITDGKWTYPRFDKALVFIPERAQKNRVRMNVVIDCAVTAQGRLSQCQILEEKPVGYELGKSTIIIFTLYTQVDPASVEGGIKPGARKRFTYKISL